MQKIFFLLFLISTGLMAQTNYGPGITVYGRENIEGPPEIEMVLTYDLKKCNATLHRILTHKQLR